MNRIIKKLRCKNIDWNRSFTVKTKFGIETEIIEVWPGGSIHRESKTFTFKWLILFIEFSAECKG